MQAQVQDISPVEKKLDIEIPWDDVRKKLDEAYRELAKDAQIKGFRRGKVPRSVLEQMFGKQVRHEVAKTLVQESLVAAAEEHKIEPVAEPVIEQANIKSGEAFRYSARLEVQSSPEVKKWEGLAGKRRKVEVDPKEVEHTLEHRRLEHTEYRIIEGRTQTSESDVLVVSLKGKVGEFPVDRPELTVDLGHTDHEPLPGLSKALTGIPLDSQDREVGLTFAADAPQKELAGKEAHLHVSIKEAREKIVPALDDEFAKDTGEADTLDELRKKISEQLEKAAAARAEHEMRDGLLKELVAQNPFPVAPALVERGMDHQLERARYSLAMMGLDAKSAGIDLAAMREKMRDSAADEVRGQLLLQSLADREKIEVSDADVDAKVAEIAAAREKPAAKIKAEMDRSGTLAALKHSLRQDKALDLVVSRATITEAPAAEQPVATGAEGQPATEKSEEK